MERRPNDKLLGVRRTLRRLMIEHDKKYFNYNEMLVPYATVALILHQDFTLRRGEKVCTAAGTCRLGGNDTVLRTLDFFGRE